MLEHLASSNESPSTRLGKHVCDDARTRRRSRFSRALMATHRPTRALATATDDDDDRRITTKRRRRDGVIPHESTTPSVGVQCTVT
jgi:hypothetical protein